MLEFDQIFDNLIKELGFEGHGSLKKLADFLETSQSGVTNWKRNKSIPSKLLLEKLNPSQFMNVFFPKVNNVTERLVPATTPTQTKARIVLDDCFQDLGIEKSTNPEKQEMFQAMVNILAKGMEAEKKPLEQWKTEAHRFIELQMGSLKED